MLKNENILITFVNYKTMEIMDKNNFPKMFLSSGEVIDNNCETFIIKEVSFNLLNKKIFIYFQKKGK
jgi:hypothetical protein